MKTVTTILLIAILLLVCAACTSQSSTSAVAQPSTPTITFDDDICEYSGPDSIQADLFNFQWVMNSQHYVDNYIWVILVEEGHSAEEYIGLTAQPSWSSTLRGEGSAQPGPWTKDVSLDLTSSARFQPGPVYILCGHRINGEITAYGVAGPVEVEE